jgi:hypothetical protein
MTKLLRAIVDEAAQARLRFLVIGGTAVNAFGHARLTLDLDLLIERSDVEHWTVLLEKLGYTRIPEQTLFAQFTPAFAGMWPVDLMLVTQQTFERMYAEACDKDIDGVAVKLPSPLHLIAMKLHALRHGRPARQAKDFTDLVEVIHLTRIDVTGEAFRRVCDSVGTKELYEQIRRAVEEG